MVEAIFIGVVLFFVVSLLRKLPVLKTWSMQGRKPIGCNLCMSWWTGVVFELIRLPMTHSDLSYRSVLSTLASMGLCFIFLSAYEALPPPPGPDLP